MLVVCLGFIGAGILIGKSYKEWQEKPIATSITTHPIDDLDFPNVTICPPRDSNTALYHDLVKAGNGPLSDQNRERLRRSAYEILMEPSHGAYNKKMRPMSHMGNLDQVVQGFHSLPIPYNDANGFKIKMWNLNGTITTPWFQKDYVVEYYQEDKEFLMVLELPDNIKDQVGSGSLLIDLEVDIRDVEGWVEEISTFTFYTTGKTWAEAESDCQKEGGHLASVTSEEVNLLIKNVTGDKSVWLGGRKELGEWTWSDKSIWGFTKWAGPMFTDCLSLSRYGSWYADECSEKYEFICQKDNNFKREETIRLNFSKNTLNFSNFLLWYNYKAASQQLLDSWKDKRMTGFRLSWNIENEHLPLTANITDVGRSIETPHFGDTLEASYDNLYRAILTPSIDLLQKMDISSLEIDLDINMKPLDEVYTFTSYILYRKLKGWADAELHCKSEGGKLASIHSKWEQQMAEKAAEGYNVWLGGRRNGSHWQWADNSTWRFSNWWSLRTDIGGDYLMMNGYGQWNSDTSSGSVWDKNINILSLPRKNCGLD